MKRYIGLRTSTGDLYSIPLALGIAIGRIGCFLTGLSDNTYGIPTSLPWAINFGDGIPRHPTQLYEILFLLCLIPFLYHVLKKTSFQKNAVIQNDSVVLSEAVTTRSEVMAQSKDPYPLENFRVPTRFPPRRRLQAFHGRLPVLPPALRLPQTLPTPLFRPRRNSVGLCHHSAVLFPRYRPLAP